MLTFVFVFVFSLIFYSWGFRKGAQAGADEVYVLVEEYRQATDAVIEGLKKDHAEERQEYVSMLAEVELINEQLSDEIHTKSVDNADLHAQIDELISFGPEGDE